MSCIKGVLQASITLSTMLVFPMIGNAKENPVEITFVKQTKEVAKWCKLYFELNNKTNFNITQIHLKYLIRDKDGGIMGKNAHGTLKAPPNKMVQGDILVDNCNDVGSIEFTEIDPQFSKIDGDSGLGNKVITQKLTSIPLMAGSQIASIKAKGPDGVLTPTNLNTNTMTLLEQAANPMTGTRALWSKFIDEGGLNYNNNFYGLEVTNINVQFEGEKIKLALLNVSSSVAPKTIRSALANVCKIKDEEWKIKNDSLIKGEAATSNMSCSYLTNNGSKSYDIVIGIK